MNQHFIPSLILQLFFLALVAVCVTARVALRDSGPPATPIADCLDELPDELPDEVFVMLVRP